MKADTMNICRIFTGEDNRYHFEDITIPLRDAGEIGKLSKIHSATSIIFRENDADYDFDWHNAPHRQFVILLDGEIEIEIGDGSKRRFKGGDIILAEDITGQGYKSRQLSPQKRRSVFVIFE